MKMEKKNAHTFVQTLLQILTFKVFWLLSKYINYYYENLTDFRKTVETGVGPLLHD